MARAKVGFVGCGSHATNNLYPVLKYARCDLQAVCDLDRSLAERNARLFGAAQVYTDAVQMLNECELDGVFVVGPPTVHYQVGKEVLSRGIALFTEKPPAPNLHAAAEMVRLARANNTFFMPGYMKRHGTAYCKARELLTSGAFTPAAGFFQYGHWANTDLHTMLLTMSSHTIDLALSLFGDATSVTSVMHQTPRAISLGLTLQFEGGQWAQLMLDSSQPRIQERMQISGTMNGDNALLVVDNVQHLELHRHRENGIDLLASSLHDVQPRFELDDIQVWRPDYGIPNMGQSRSFFQGFAGEIREFADAILEKREPYPGTEDVLKAMRVIEAIITKPNGTSEL